MYNADENELLHELDDLQRQVKELEEENVRLRSSTPIVANIEVNPTEIEEIKNKFKVVYKALELAIRQITESCVEMDFPFEWVCCSENCDRRCEVKKGKYEGKLAFNCERECWRDFFLKKAGEEVNE